jgi:taurine--2-oxoglutarate transaminase
MATQMPVNTLQQQVQQWERNHVLYPWSRQGGLKPYVITRAEGNYFWDAEGNKYLDFTSQFANANPGHGDPRIVEAIIEQARSLPFVASPFASEPKAKLARLLAEVTPGDLTKTLFSTGGAEANEAAIKICRLATGKHKIVSRYRSYHGSTYGSMTVARDFRSWPGEPGMPGVVHALDPYCYRCPFGTEFPQCDLQCAQHVEDVIRMQGGRPHIAGVIVEPIVGANGIIVPPDGYLQRLREICDKHEVLLVVDEVMTGFGRTGEWFACDLWDVVPDIMALAKGLTGGNVPLGATVVTQQIAEYFDEETLFHGHTYSGHALACAAGVRTIQVYQEDNLIERARELGPLLLAKAQALKEKHPAVGDVRGKGLFVGLELVKNRETKEPMTDYMEPLPKSGTIKHAVLAAAMKRGVYMMPGVASVVTLAPPLTITEEEIEWAISVLDEVLVIADKETTPF